MVIFGLIVTAFLALCFFCCLKRRKITYFDAIDWFFYFSMFGVVGILLGWIISLGIGKYVVPSEFVLVETCALEPVIAEGKEVFVIKNKESNFSNYFYFTKGLNDCPLEVDSILLEEKDIKFREGEVKRMLNKYKKIPNGNLKWFFFTSYEKQNELVLLSKEDIL